MEEFPKDGKTNRSDPLDKKVDENYEFPNNLKVHNLTDSPNMSSRFSKLLMIGIALILLAAMFSVIGFFWILPALGIAIALTTGAWGVVIATVVLLSIALLLFFIIPFFLVVALCVLALVWVAGAIIFFPIVFPVVIPLVIILLFIGYLRKK